MSHLSQQGINSYSLVKLSQIYSTPPLFPHHFFPHHLALYNWIVLPNLTHLGLSNRNINCSYHSPLKNFWLSVVYKIKFKKLYLENSLQPSHNLALQAQPPLLSNIFLKFTGTKLFLFQPWLAFHTFCFCLLHSFAQILCATYLSLKDHFFNIKDKHCLFSAVFTDAFPSIISCSFICLPSAH